MTLIIELENKELAEEARTLGHHKTEMEAITAALSEYVEHHRRKKILDLFGTVEYDPDYDYKAHR